MKKLVVLSGAGISVESGGSTFRGANGLWGKYPIEQVATPEGYASDPELVLNFYNDMRRQLLTSLPNKGHKLIAELEKEFNVTVVTQNIDDLHERAGSTRVIHLHGELTKVCSSYSPYDQRYVKELSPEEYNIKVGDLAPDGSQYRPYIVWYGEAVPKIDEAIQYVQEADIFLIIGTSLNVYPAAGLLNYVPFKTSVYLVDPNEVTVNTNHHHIHVIRKVASEGMSEFVRLLTGQVNA